MSDYNVVLLIEQALSDADARQVRSLHEDIGDPVHYFVLKPVENAASRIESGIGALGAGEVMATPAMVMADEDIEELQKDLLADCRSGVDATIKALTDAGGTATGEALADEPINGSRQEGRRGRRRRGDHPDPAARGRRVLPPGLDLPRPPQARRTRPAPTRARELRRAGRRRRGRQRVLDDSRRGRPNGPRGG